MAIDTSIYGNIKPVQIENPLENYGRLMQLQQAQQQNRLADLAYGEKQREISGDNALASLLAGGKTGSDVSQGLAAAGYGNKSMAYTKAMQEQLKQQAEIGKTKAEASYKEVEAAHKRVELIGQGLGYLKDNPTLENAQGVIKHFVDIGIMPPEVAQQKLADFQRDPSPEGIRKLALRGYQGALSAKDQLPKIETRNLGGTTDTLAIDPISGKVVVTNSVKNTVSPDAVLSSDTARRGQNISASTAAAGRAQADRHFTLSQASGKVPAGYRANPDGSLSFIPGGPADPNAAGGGKMTEDQGKATGWLIQAENAYKNMMAVGVDKNGNPTSAAKPGFNDALAAIPSFGATTGLANAMRGADRQKFIQATSSLSEALLRAATGAGVNKDEAAQKVQELTPLFGEDPAVTKQKYAAIPLYIESLKVRAGPGAKKAADVLSGSNDIHSQAEAILRGGK